MSNDLSVKAKLFLKSARANSITGEGEIDVRDDDGETFTITVKKSKKLIKLGEWVEKRQDAAPMSLLGTNPCPFCGK